MDAGKTASDGYVMALDAGTTSVRAVIFDEYGCVVGQAQQPISTYYPHPGWVEQDPTEILSRQIACMSEVQFKTGIHSDRIRAIGITNQRETVVVWDKSTGLPVYNAIVWQCRRTAPMVDELAGKGYGDLFQSRTGLVLDAYFSGTKIKWILDNVEGAREAAEAGDLLCGTIDCWLVYNLTQDKNHLTDYTNASRTLLFDIKTLQWDEELCEILGVPMSMLPKALPSSCDFGAVSADVMSRQPHITGIAGDQQAALFGHCCFEPGSVKNTYGTGCFMLMNVGPEPVRSKAGLVTTIGIAEGGTVDYALEGSVYQAGTVIQWLRDELGIISSAPETEAISLSIPDTGGCHVIPAFTGLGAPWWDQGARGMICGITRGTGRAQIVRAACESIAFQTLDIFESMQADSGCEIKTLEVDGGGSNNGFIMQFQADLIDAPVVRGTTAEVTALGAAYLAGLCVGYWGSREELVSMRAESKRFVPSIDAAKRAELIAGWRGALKRALSDVSA